MRNSLCFIYVIEIQLFVQNKLDVAIHRKIRRIYQLQAEQGFAGHYETDQCTGFCRNRSGSTGLMCKLRQKKQHKEAKHISRNINVMECYFRNYFQGQIFHIQGYIGENDYSLDHMPCVTLFYSKSIYQLCKVIPLHSDQILIIDQWYTLRVFMVASNDVQEAHHNHQKQ